MYGTPEDVIQFTGVRPDTLGIEGEHAEQQLYNLLTEWLERISTAIDVRLAEGSPVRPTDKRHKGIVDIAVRTVAKMVTIAQQQRSNPVIQINEFSVTMINPSLVIKDLDEELRPYIHNSLRRSKIQFFSSIPNTTR